MILSHALRLSSDFHVAETLRNKQTNLWSGLLSLPAGYNWVQGSMVPGYLFLNQGLHFKGSEMDELATLIVGSARKGIYDTTVANLCSFNYFEGWTVKAHINY